MAPNHGGWYDTKITLHKEQQMSFGITKTIPADTDQAFVESLFDGSRRTYEFHMAGAPSRLSVGDYVYAIYKDHLIGRLKISSFVEGATNPNSGRPRTLILVACPGERLATPVPRQGHRGTRYFEGEGWPG
jgi:hypothetical protein